MTEDLRSRHGFTQCLEPLADELVIFARRMVIHRDDAEDVLQASLAAAWNHRGRFQTGTNFRAWVFRFVVHEALNSNRRRSATSSRVKALADDVPDREFWRRLDAEQAYREEKTHHEGHEGHEGHEEESSSYSFLRALRVLFCEFSFLS